LFPPRKFPPLIFYRISNLVITIALSQRRPLRTSTMSWKSSSGLALCLSISLSPHARPHLLNRPERHTTFVLILSWPHVRTTGRLAPSTTWRSSSTHTLGCCIDTVSETLDACKDWVLVQTRWCSIEPTSHRDYSTSKRLSNTQGYTALNNIIVMRAKVTTWSRKT